MTKHLDVQIVLRQKARRRPTTANAGNSVATLEVSLLVQVQENVQIVKPFLQLLIPQLRIELSRRFHRIPTLPPIR